MSVISEAELEDAGRNRAIKKLTISQQRNSKFGIAVNLTWKEGEFTLVTQRKNTREWASLDRLSLHIQEKYGAIAQISLTLLPTEEINK
ncbi:MAG: hypothetical protein V4633_05140 [Pseudomonadota bacterium]